MSALYLASLGYAAGKTGLCAALGQRLRGEGRRVAFLKPIAIEPEEGGIDGDVEFLKETLGLEEDAASLGPVVLAPDKAQGELAARQDELFSKIKTAYDRVAQSTDVVLLEGLGSLDGETNLKVAELLDAKILLLARWGRDLPLEQIIAAAETAKGRFVGAVLNAVPQRRAEEVRKSAVPHLEGRGVKVLGLLPEDRALFAASVGELAANLKGELIDGSERQSELVENLMLGAMLVDSGLEYFGRKSNKAVITRGDRPDLQLAALETSTRCLILTGDVKPHPMVLNQAKEKGVPLIVVGGDTPSTVEALEGALGKSGFRGERKLERLAELMEQHLDFDALYRELGIGA